MVRSVGIDDIVVHAPATRLNLLGSEFVEARCGSDPADKFRGKLRYLGVEYAAVPDGGQNVATLGTTALHQLMEQNDLKPRDVGRVVVATESSFDNAKPMGTDIKGMVEDVYGPYTTNHWDTSEIKFACNAGGRAVLDTVDWIRARENQGKAGVVVATDFAKYDLCSSGEFTGGTGAVAVLVTQQPRLMEFVPGVRGTSSRNAYDFWKPFKTDNGDGTFGSHGDTPLVDGQYSIGVYMETMRDAADMAWKKAQQKGIGKPGQPLTDTCAKFAMHIPFPEMGRKSMAMFFRHNIRDTQMAEEIASEIGEPEPPLADEKARDVHLKKMRQAKTWVQFEEDTFLDSLRWPSKIGNSYTASQFVSLASTFAYAARRGERLEGTYIGNGWYGSGAQAMMALGRVRPGWKEVARGMKFEEQPSRELSLGEYEALHAGYDLPGTPALTEPQDWRLVGIDAMGKRAHSYHGRRVVEPIVAKSAA